MFLGNYFYICFNFPCGFGTTTDCVEGQRSIFCFIYKLVRMNDLISALSPLCRVLNHLVQSSSFVLCFIWTETSSSRVMTFSAPPPPPKKRKKKSRRISSYLDWTALVDKGFSLWRKDSHSLAGHSEEKKRPGETWDCRIYQLSVNQTPGGSSSSNGLLGTCRWMGLHFHDLTDYNGITSWRIFKTVTRMGSHFFRNIQSKKKNICPN